MFCATTNVNDARRDNENNIYGHVIYYTVNSVRYDYYITGDSLVGSYVNSQVVDGETLGIPGDYYFGETYDDYTYVNKYAVPLYWQLTNPIVAYRGMETVKPFPHFYILRIYSNGKEVDDRETDIICLAAKDSTFEN